MSRRVVAVIGASTDRTKFGNKAVRAFRAAGDIVIPINPRETAVEGLKAYRSVLDVPGSINMATVYVSPEVGVRVLDEVARKGIAEVWLNPGADGEAVIEKGRALGLTVIAACSIIGAGMNPAQF